MNLYGLVLLGILSVVSSQHCSDVYTVMTYNLDCALCDFEWRWSDRLNAFKDIFQRYQPDLYGSQELIDYDEVKQIIDILPGNYSAVFYQGHMDYPESGTIWLSPTPDVPFSEGFSSKQVAPRIWVWAQLRVINTGQEFLFTTTHFDNNRPCQEESAPLVLDRTAPYSFEMPVITTGDFNSNWNTTAYQILTTGVDTSDYFHFLQSFEYTSDWKVNTNQSPTPAYDETDAIDHIFFAGKGVQWTISNWNVDIWTYEHNRKNLYPSDHFPVVADLQFCY